MVVKSKQLCEYPLDQKERPELTAAALSLRDLGRRALLSVLCLLWGLCVSHTPSGSIVSTCFGWIPTSASASGDVAGMHLQSDAGAIVTCGCFGGRLRREAVGGVAPRMGSGITHLVVDSLP